MGNLPIYNCPDVSLYPYSDTYNELYKNKVFELDGLLQYFDNNNRLNEAYKKFLRFNRLKDDEKEAFISEISTIKAILLENTNFAINKGYTIISLADPLSSLEFIGINSAKNYLNLFLLDFLEDLRELCRDKAHIHLCPKLSILLIKVLNTSEYKLNIKTYKSDKNFASLLEFLLAKKNFSISGLKCIHYYGNIDHLALFEFEKID